MNILLAYVSLPITTAIYIDRALRKNHTVISLGVKPEYEFNKSLDINLHSTELDIYTNISPDIKLISDIIKTKIIPDLFLWIDTGTDFFPANIEQLDFPSAAYFIDTHLHLEQHIQLSKNFDYVFIAQREYLDEFKKNGIQSVHWLPLGCDPEIHFNYKIPSIHNICFVGSTDLNPRRQKLLNKIKEKFAIYSDRLFLKEMAKAFSESKIVFNSAVRNDLNMRFFETLSTGSLLLTDKAHNSGQEEMFKNNIEIACYEDEGINNVIEFYLENDELRSSIAQRGHSLVLNAHTYEHRVNDLISVVTGEKTTTLSSEEIREISLQNCPITTNQINKLKRSFVIPVIDYSPASKYNISTLLKDLEVIEGNVIIIFNSEKVADEIKNHPRIDYYAIMKKNVGVSRAWNIGLDMSFTPITFILNSDLHIKLEAVEKLESAIITLENAAMVGPQGNDNHFYTIEDFQYYDKGTFNNITEVDSVSGFFFAVKTKYFHQSILKFENLYTPCYFEEWDIGLQIKNAGLKSYVIPTTEYSHKWSGSIKSMNTIKYFDKEFSVEEIRKRNLLLYLEKWINLKRLGKVKEEIFISCWVTLQLNKQKALITKGLFNTVRKNLNIIKSFYPDYYKINYYEALLHYKTGDISIATELLTEIIKYHPNYEEASKLLKEISS